MESELEVHEFLTSYGRGLSIKLPGGKTVTVTPFDRHTVELDELDKAVGEMESMGYACTVNFEHESVVCVK